MNIGLEVSKYISIGNILSIATISLLLFITISIVYLTTVEWKDKRRVKRFNSLDKKK